MKSNQGTGSSKRADQGTGSSKRAELRDWQKEAVPDQPTRSRVSADREGRFGTKKQGATDNVLATRGFAAMCEPRTRSNLERSYFLPVVEGAKGTWEMHGGFSAAS